MECTFLSGYLLPLGLYHPAPHDCHGRFRNPAADPSDTPDADPTRAPADRDGQTAVLDTVPLDTETERRHPEGVIRGVLGEEAAAHLRRGDQWRKPEQSKGGEQIRPLPNPLRWPPSG